jgi:hypothetical protein
MLTSLILFVALCSQCESGTCRVPVRTVVEKTKTVVVEKQPARTLVKKTVHRERLLRVRFWR